MYKRCALYLCAYEQYMDSFRVDIFSDPISNSVQIRRFIPLCNNLLITLVLNDQIFERDNKFSK